MDMSLDNDDFAPSDDTTPPSLLTYADQRDDITPNNCTADAEVEITVDETVHVFLPNAASSLGFGSGDGLVVVDAFTSLQFEQAGSCDHLSARKENSPALDEAQCLNVNGKALEIKVELTMEGSSGENVNNNTAGNQEHTQSSLTSNEVSSLTSHGKSNAARGENDTDMIAMAQTGTDMTLTVQSGSDVTMTVNNGTDVAVVGQDGFDGRVTEHDTRNARDMTTTPPPTFHSSEPGASMAESAQGGSSTSREPDASTEGGDKVCTVVPSVRNTDAAVLTHQFVGVSELSDGGTGMNVSGAEMPAGSTGISASMSEAGGFGNATFCSLCDDSTSVGEGHCQECNQDLCSACIQRHGKMAMATDHTIILCPTSELDDEGDRDAALFHQQQSHRLSFRSSTMDGVDRCRKHREEKLRFFCKTCQQPVCRDCILTAHKHHITEDIGDATLSARCELASMMRQLGQRRQLLESHLSALDDHKANILQQAQQVQDIMDKFYSDVTAALESSYRDLVEKLESLKRGEEERVQTLAQVVHNNIEDVARLLGQQATTDSSIFVLSQHEIVSLALKTLDYNMQQMGMGRCEFFITKNPKLVSFVEATPFLGAVTFSTTPPSQSEHHTSAIPGHTASPPGRSRQPSAIPKPVILEVSLHKEMAFNIFQSSEALSRVCAIMETGSGAIWVATPHALLKVLGTAGRDCVPVTEVIAGIVAGPGDKLLVSLGQGSTIKLFSGGNSWANFASIPKGSAVIASRLHGNNLKVYVAVSSVTLATTKILAYSTDGQVCRQLKLPPEIFDTPSVAIEATENFHGSTPSLASSQQPFSGLNVSCMAVGSDGELVLGTAVGGGRVVMVDPKGQLTGQYRGVDGTGCHPSGLCIVGDGSKVIVADSQHSTIELIDMRGKLLATLLTRDGFQTSGLIGVLTAIAVDSKQRLWVGTSMGHVCAYSFLHTIE